MTSARQTDGEVTVIFDFPGEFFGGTQYFGPTNTYVARLCPTDSDRLLCVYGLDQNNKIITPSYPDIEEPEGQARKHAQRIERTVSTLNGYQVIESAEPVWDLKVAALAELDNPNHKEVAFNSLIGR